MRGKRGAGALAEWKFDCFDQGRFLEINYDDQTSYALTAELLRVRSPSAEVQGHWQRDQKTVAANAMLKFYPSRPLVIMPYAWILTTAHRTGIYTWRYLRTLGETKDQSFAAYLDELSLKGLNRDVAGK